MASKAFLLLSDKAIPEEPARSATKGPGNPGSDPEDGGFESTLGRAEGAWRVAEARRQDFRTDHLSLDAEEKEASITANPFVISSMANRKFRISSFGVSPAFLAANSIPLWIAATASAIRWSVMSLSDLAGPMMIQKLGWELDL